MPVGLVVYAKDLAVLSAFYAALSRTGITHQETDHAELGPYVTIVRVPDSIAAEIEIAQPPVRRENAAVKAVFEVASLEIAKDLVLGLGGAMNDAHAQWRFGDWLVCDGADPEGNVFELRQHLAAH